MSLFTGSLTNLYQIFKSNKEDHKEENKNMDNEHSYLSRVIAKFVINYLLKVIFIFLSTSI